MNVLGLEHRSGRTGRAPVTMTEALLAVFAVGLLLGLWLGRESERRQLEQLRRLESRIESLEMQRALFKPFLSPGRHGTQSQGSSRTESPSRSSAEPGLQV
jgi:hypothetical protein